MKLSAKTKLVFYGRPGETGESAAGSHIQPLNCSERSVRRGENVCVPIIMHFRSNCGLRLAEESEGKAEPDALQRLDSLCSCVLLCDTQ